MLPFFKKKKKKSEIHFNAAIVAVLCKKPVSPWSHHAENMAYIF